MLYTIMKHIHNVFPVKHINGAFNITDGAISLSDIKEGQYFLIEGSMFNDGVYKYPVGNLHDEEFSGCVTLLTPPREFLDLVDEISSYVEKDTRGAFQSESFGGYSYTRATVNGKMADWTDIFSQRLNVWRKL